MNDQTTPSPAPGPSNPFSVVAALSDAFTYVLSGFLPLFRMSWPWLAFTVAAAAAFFAAIGWYARAEGEIAVHILIATALALAFLVSTAYYVAVVRNWMLGEQSPRILRVYPLFLLRVVLLTLLLVAIAAAIFVPVFIAGILGFDHVTAGEAEPSAALIIGGIIALILTGLIALAIGMYFAARLTPWFVAAAVERPLSASQSWRMTKGAGIRIVAGALGLAIAFGVADLAIETALSPLLGVTSDAFELLYSGEKLVPLFVLVLLKIAVYFVQVAASMVYCGSVYRQTSGG